MTTNNNNAAQTLFRFVSLRNPKLTETKTKNIGFIHRFAEISDLFDEAAASRDLRISKFEAIANRSREFENDSIKNLSDLESGYFAEFLKIGKKISQKKSLSNVEIDYLRENYNLLGSGENLKEEGREKIRPLWTNLIYQVVTQKDFYVKEAIIHILKAIHIGYVLQLDQNEEFLEVNGREFLEKAMTAKVVLPSELFSAALSAESSSGTAQLPTRDIQRLKAEADDSVKISRLTYEKEALENLQKEMAKLEKEYRISRDIAYKEAFNAYQEEYKEHIALYDRKLAEIEGRITEETPVEEQQTLYESLKEFEVPPFEFSYPNEINLSDLHAKLTPESLNLFLELFSDFDFEDQTKIDRLQGVEPQILSESTMRLSDTIIQLDTEQQSFSAVSAKISAYIAAAIQTIIDTSQLPQQQYTNIGGALVPVSSAGNITHLAYSLLVSWKRRLFSPNGMGNVSFSFEVENSSWNVLSAKLSATTNQGNIVENFTNIEVVNNKVSFPLMLVNRFTTISSFRLEIFFANGRESVLQLSNLTNDQLYTGILTLNTIKDIIPETGGGSEEGSTAPRKNFGIKRIGVADYLKVVQSVHAYVPGEVSNIENVMASELRHKSSVARDYSEITDTASKSEETEKISDTTKTSRTDMQTEVAKELDKQQSFSAHARSEGKIAKWTLEVGANYANNTAQHDSTRQAVMKSQEITERAMERVLTKISEERVQKIIKEYTETNVHEFDNRGKVTDTDNPDAARPQHITGVYRWIDKKMKNQIYNYGKRTMFEFMVPEPAKLHRLALTVAKAEQLTAPVDPRKAPEPHTMPNAKAATKELLEYWAGIYGVTLTVIPELNKIFVVNKTEPGIGNSTRTVKFDVPQNYSCEKIEGPVHCESGRKLFVNTKVWIYHPVHGGEIHYSPNRDSYLNQVGGLNIQNSVDLNVKGRDLESVQIQLKMHCKLSDTFMEAWQTESFNAIIAAYEAALQKFQEAQAAIDAAHAEQSAESREKTGNFYRYMEADVLKHNCIAYLLQDYLNVLGQPFTKGETMPTFEVILGEKLDRYTALAKFMEQAFEWELMDYTFYPYYWADRGEWQKMYISESVDPLFRSFLQAGMARVVVTVKPGFEDAVQFFLETGLIWNGGEVPVIGEPMYMSIVDEMREPTGLPQGKYWITRIPTTLTILQDKSTGLPVDQPLPIFPETDPDNCENPLELETETSFEARNTSLGIELEKESTLGQ